MCLANVYATLCRSQGLREAKAQLPIFTKIVEVLRLFRFSGTEDSWRRLMQRTCFLTCLVAVLVATACRDANDFENERIPGDPPPALTATVSGKVFWEGEPPPARRIPTSADPACKNPKLVSEEYVVSDGGLENVIVYVSSGLEGKTFPAPKDSVQLDQSGCRYVPHALTLQTNQPLVIANNDETCDSTFVNQ
jgi:hypothetical protein